MSEGKKVENSGYSFPEVDEDRLDEDEQRETWSERQFESKSSRALNAETGLFWFLVQTNIDKEGNLLSQITKKSR